MSTKAWAAEVLQLDDTPDFWLQATERAVRNARLKGHRKAPRWVAVQDVFGHGSTYSKALCVYFGLDPDEELRRE